MDAQKALSNRAAICRKYADQFWREHEAGKLPNLALIINDAIADGVNDYLEYMKPRTKSPLDSFADALCNMKD